MMTLEDGEEWRGRTPSRGEVDVRPQAELKEGVGMLITMYDEYNITTNASVAAVLM